MITFEDEKKALDYEMKFIKNEKKKKRDKAFKVSKAFSKMEQELFSEARHIIKSWKAKEIQENLKKEQKG